MKSLILICAVGMAFGQTTSPCVMLVGGKCLITQADNEKCDRYRIDHGKVTYLCEPEPLDVPAIQELTREPFNCSMNPLSGSPRDGWYQWGYKNWEGTTICGTKRPMVTTCADKERILEHSESGKYWCRKVQN